MKYKQLVILLFSILLLSSFAIAGSYNLVEDFEGGSRNATMWDSYNNQSTRECSVNGTQVFEGSYSFECDGDASQDMELITSSRMGIDNSGSWVISYYTYTDEASISDDNQFELVEGGYGDICFLTNAGYPNANNWGYYNGIWVNTGVSSTSGRGDTAQNWVNIRLLVDYDNNKVSWRIGNTSSNDLTNASYLGGCVDPYIAIFRSADTDSNVYFDKIETWDYDVYGWEYSDAPPTPTFSHNSTATDTDPETEDTSTLLNLSIEWTCENCNATGTDTTIDGISGNLTYNGTLYTPTVINSSYGVNGSIELQVNLTTPIFDLNNTQLNYIWRYELTNGTSNPTPTYIPSNKSGTQNITFKYPRINITATNKLSGSTINNFTTNITGTNYFNSLTTTTGNNLHIINATTINQTYNITIDGEGFAISNQTITLNNTNYSLNQVSFELYTTNSLNITFKNIETNNLMNGTNINIEFIGLTARNETTNNGTLYVDLFSPDTYTITYDAEGYEQGKYIVNIADRTYQALTLYLQNATNAELVLITVQDRFGNDLTAVQVIIQRYLNNAWATEQIIETDFQGRTEGYYVLSTQYYNHVLKYNNLTYFGVINDDTNKKMIYAEDVNNGINFNIDILGTSQLENYYDTLGVTTSLTYINTTNTTGYFRYYFSDSGNTDRTARLIVTKGGSNTEVCDNSTTSSTGILTCNINQSSGLLTYKSIGTIDGFSAGSLNKLLGISTTRINWGVTGYLVAFLLVIVSFFAFLSNPTISILFGTSIFLILSVMGIIFQDVSYGVFITLLAIAFMIARIKSEGGING